jgi:hypothetical protein
MSPDRDTTRIVRSWLQTDEYESADRVLDAVLDQLDTTPQRRAGWLGRRLPHMNTTAKLAIAAAAVVVAAFLGIRFLLPAQNIGSDGPTPTPAPSPAAFHTGALTAGTYVMTPFTGVGASGVCMPEAAECAEDPADDSYRLTFTVPDGYDAVSNQRPLIFGPNGDTGMIILRGADLYSDPCHSTPPPDIAVGPTVDDFANAIASHPDLDATDPVDVTLAGYPGKYIDLQLPADNTACTPDGQFWPYEPGMYAQGNSNLWHLWILDVAGVRVVIQSMDYPDTPADKRAELQAIVDSIQIEP